MSGGASVLYLRDPLAPGSERKLAYYAYAGHCIGESPDSTAGGPRSAYEARTLGLTFSLPDRLCADLGSGCNGQAIATRAPALGTRVPWAPGRPEGLNSEGRSLSVRSLVNLAQSRTEGSGLHHLGKILPPGAQGTRRELRLFFCDVLGLY